MSLGMSNYINIQNYYIYYCSLIAKLKSEKKLNPFWVTYISCEHFIQVSTPTFLSHFSQLLILLLQTLQIPFCKYSSGILHSLMHFVSKAFNMLPSSLEQLFTHF